MPHYTLFRANGEVREITIAWQRHRKIVQGQVRTMFNWESVCWSERPLWYNKKKGGMVVMIWNEKPEGEINQIITRSLELGYEKMLKKNPQASIIPKNWGEGIRGDVVVKSQKPLL